MFTAQQIQEKFDTFVQSDDEVGAREFISQNINEFPEDVRDELVFQLSSDALITDSTFESLKEAVFSAIDALERAKSEDENELKVLDLKDQLAK